MKLWNKYEQWTMNNDACSTCYETHYQTYVQYDVNSQLISPVKCEIAICDFDVYQKA